MQATKEIIEAIGYQILKDLGINNYYEEEAPIIGEKDILVFSSKGTTKKEKGWSFIIAAPNWQFENNRRHVKCKAVIFQG